MIAKFYLVFVAVLALLSANAFAVDSNAPTASAVCAQEAKLCSDGSSVSRTGPDCEFAPCPSTDRPSSADNIRGSIEGRIVKGPLSPAERVGEVNAIGVAGEVAVTSETGEGMVIIASDLNGLFQIDLPPGQYTLQLRSADPAMAAKPQTITVERGEVTKTELMLDTGLR